MSDVVQVMNMMGLTPYVIGLVAGLAAIAVYHTWIKKA